MPYKIVLRPLAALEIIEAFDWYETQKTGLGEQFLNSLDVFYEKLLVNPHSHSYYSKPIRQGTLYKFPYSVVYEIFDVTIVIYSVFMAKQQPSKMRTF